MEVKWGLIRERAQLIVGFSGRREVKQRFQIRKTSQKVTQKG